MNMVATKKIMQLIGLFGLLLGLFACNSSTPAPPQMIPLPAEYVFGSGTFNLSKETPIYTNIEGDEKKLLLDYMQQSPLQLSQEVEEATKKSLELIVTKNDAQQAESYSLSVSTSGIRIEASDGAGLFYGLQSLLQLADQYGAGSLPAITINDSPRFAYRGFMMDVSRHFFSKEFVKKQIDMMAYYKFNRLHWHLVDGPGWRIEIKKYPQLTQNAAWRPYEDCIEWSENGRKFCTEDTPNAYGGYYTQEDIKEVVAYAQKRYITIIPEIELPGHNEEVLAVFPELSCAGKPYVNQDLCIGNPDTYIFLENVLTEVMALFPSQYIHIGGDEAEKTGWKTCKKCKKCMEREGLANVDDLQSHMIHQIEVFLNKNGRALLGWDEIMEGGLAPNATVMSWRGQESGITAAKSGHDVVMNPSQYLYLNFYQDAPQSQPLSWAGYTPIEKVYSLNPVPDSLSAQEQKHILGVQANLWTEYIHTPEHAEMMIWPRLLAVAEIAWVQPEQKSYARFRENALKAVDFLKARGYNAFDLKNEVGERKERSDTLRHLAYGKPVEYKNAYNSEYSGGGDMALTDGLQGGWGADDKRWQGFIPSDVDVIVNLEKVETIHSINANFIQDSFGWFWMPKVVEIYTSVDNKDFVLLKTIENRQPFTAVGFFINDFGWTGETSAQYIRYVAKRDRDNEKVGFLLTDEIVVK